MKNVRNSTDGHCPRPDGANAGNGKIPGAAKTAGRIAGMHKGGDQIDPRLFYFRALLESDRFFGGGARF